MSTVTLNLEEIVKWSEGRRVDTRNGPRILLTAAPTDAFWQAWREQKDELRSHGISLGKHFKTGQWEVCWWKELPKGEQERINQTIEASQQVGVEADIPKPDNGMDYYPYQKAGIQFALRVFGKLK